MTSLTDKLKAKLAFDDDLSWEDEDALHKLDRACLRGQYLENARLAPLHAKLIKCVEMLQAIDRRAGSASVQSGFEDALEVAEWSRQALADLKKELAK